MRMTVAEDAVELVDDGMNCSQAVLIALGEPLGIDRRTAAGVALAFGGGMACTGQTCGAVTGGLMVIGLHCNKARRFAFRRTNLAYALGRDFIQRFEARAGFIQCKQLLEAGGTADSVQQAMASEIYRTHCQKLVHDAVEILDELLGNMGAET